MEYMVKLLDRTLNVLHRCCCFWLE